MWVSIRSSDFGRLSITGGEEGSEHLFDSLAGRGQKIYLAHNCGRFESARCPQCNCCTKNVKSKYIIQKFASAAGRKYTEYTHNFPRMITFTHQFLLACASYRFGF